MAQANDADKMRIDFAGHIRGDVQKRGDDEIDIDMDEINAMTWKRDIPQRASPCGQRGGV